MSTITDRRARLRALREEGALAGGSLPAPTLTDGDLAMRQLTAEADEQDPARAPRRRQPRAGAASGEPAGRQERQRTREQDARRREEDRLVVEHLGLAEAIANRYRVPSVDWRDLRQVAYLGLVKAARRYDPERGNPFASLAVPTVSGEIKRYLRDHAALVRSPRHLHELRSAIWTVSPQLAQELGREPTPAELARELRAAESDIREALRTRELGEPVSLDVVVGGTEDGAPLSEFVGVEDGRLEHAELMLMLSGACRRLAPRERLILFLRFYRGWSQQEIGRELGVTQMQISRLLAAILEKLRTDLTQANVHEEVVSNVA